MLIASVPWQNSSCVLHTGIPLDGWGSEVTKEAGGKDQCPSKHSQGWPCWEPPCSITQKRHHYTSSQTTEQSLPSLAWTYEDQRSSSPAPPAQIGTSVSSNDAQCARCCCKCTDTRLKRPMQPTAQAPEGWSWLAWEWHRDFSQPHPECWQVTTIENTEDLWGYVREPDWWTPIGGFLVALEQQEHN